MFPADLICLVPSLGMSGSTDVEARTHTAYLSYGLPDSGIHSIGLDVEDTLNVYKVKI